MKTATLQLNRRDVEQRSSASDRLCQGQREKADDFSNAANLKHCVATRSNVLSRCQTLDTTGQLDETEMSLSCFSPNDADIAVSRLEWRCGWVQCRDSWHTMVSDCPAAAAHVSACPTRCRSIRTN